MMPVIACPRLDLHHLPAPSVITLFETPEDQSIYAGTGFTNPHRVLVDDSGPLRWRVPQVLADPGLNRWFVRWAVLRDEAVIIGSSSFHGPPDEAGMIEIGLGVHPDFWGLGYGREILEGMWGWVTSQPGVVTLRYTVSAENARSVRLVESFGFAHVGQQIDEEAGPEVIYELTARAFQEKFGRS